MHGAIWILSLRRCGQKLFGVLFILSFVIVLYYYCIVPRRPYTMDPDLGPGKYEHKNVTLWINVKLFDFCEP